MKFGYKIFLMSFTLVIIAINTTGIILINNSFKANIENEIDKNMIEINNIASSIYINAEDFPYTANTYRLNKVHTKIYLGDNVIYTNFNEENIELENKLKKDLSDKVNFYIEDGKLYMALEKHFYTIFTISDIKDVYEAKDNQISYFIKISLISSLFVALILSILVSLITRKIKKLKKSVEEIEKGNYEVKIPKLGNDEIGNFATSFQNMTISINNKIKEIERISENRKIFIGNLTHEIRTPLTSIIGYSSLIKNGKVDNVEIIKSYSNKIYEEGKYIEDLRDKLMHLLTLEKDKILTKKQNISFCINKYLEDIERLYPEVVLKKVMEANIIKEIEETLFKSLFYNLMKNAINASPKPIIKVTLTKEEIRIEDNGKGIPKSEIERIKEPFYTINKDRNRKTSGMGLGLPLCLQIVNIHHWNLKIKSKENKGTTIIIEMRNNK